MKNTPPIGTKFDSNKSRPGLLPAKPILAISDVLTFGAQKYSDDNWKVVDNGVSRYTDAMMRHILAWKTGEKNDSESGLHHLAHAGCCLLFLLWHELETDDNKAKQVNELTRKRK